MPTQLKLSLPTRPFHLAIGALIEAIGGYKVAARICLVTPITVEKWKESPDESGQVIPVKHLQSLLTAVGEQLENHAVQIAADEVMQEYFLNLYHRRCYPTEKVFEFIEMLQGQERKAVVND